MKTMILFTLLYATLGLAQENKTFSGSYEAVTNLSMGVTRCQGTYLSAPITQIKSVTTTEDASFEIGLPDKIWIATASDSECENLRFELSQRSLLSTVATFDIKGSSFWQTDRIGRGCGGRTCQSYQTNADLTGDLQGLKISDIYSEDHWLGHAPYVTPIPGPKKLHPHCNPLALFCHEN